MATSSIALHCAAPAAADRPRAAGRAHLRAGAVRAPAVAASSRTAFLSGGRIVGSATRVSVRQAARTSVVRAAQAPSVGEKSAASSSGDVMDCVVVGGGISGLCTGMALQTKHADNFKNIMVTEGRERVGGNITTVSNDEYLWEEGPNSFQPGDPILRMAVDAGVADQLVLGDPKAPRFVYWDGRLRATPSGPDVLTFDLLSIWGKIRAGLGAAGIMNGSLPKKEESVEEFVRRNLGEEVFMRLIEPFCSGVYAGDPSKLSMKAAFGKVWRLEDMGGSIVGGSLKLMNDRKANPPPPRDADLPEKPAGPSVGSFRYGLKTLPEAIEGKLGDQVKVNWKLTAMKKDGDLWKLTYDTPEGEQMVTSKTVVLTTPSYVAAELVKDEAPAAAEELKGFYYPPVAAVTVSLPKSSINEDRLDDLGKLPGFGQLHPRSQGVTTLGTIYSSSLFPGRCPDGEVLLLNYIGGAKNLKIMDMTDEEILAQVDEDLRIMLVKEGAPKVSLVGLRKWGRAIPQFNVGHLDKLEAAKEGLAKAGCDGLFLGGNYVCGVALGRCVEGAYESAQVVADHVKSKVSA